MQWQVQGKLQYNFERFRAYIHQKCAYTQHIPTQMVHILAEINQVRQKTSFPVIDIAIRQSLTISQ
jgi:hypothetical protein